MRYNLKTQHVKYTYFLSLVFLFSMILLVTPCASAQRPLVIGYNQDLAPSFYWSEDGEKGIDAEILAELFRRSSLTSSIRLLPWARVIAETKDGRIDAGCPGFKTPEREEFAIFLDQPLNYAIFSIFTRRGEEFAFTGLDDLHGKSVGINRGYSISPEVNAPQHQGKIRFEETASAEQNLKKLVAGRIDAYAGNRDAALFIATQLGIVEQITVLPTPINEPRPVYLMISKAAELEKKAEIIRMLNQHLNDMWQDGTIERIVNTYIQLPSFLGK